MSTLQKAYCETICLASIDMVVSRTNAFLMKNKGVTAFSYEGIEHAMNLLEMLENMAKSVVIASVLVSVQTTPESEVRKLDRVLQKRKRDAAGCYESLSDGILEDR